jgi:hypothetical protein
LVVSSRYNNHLNNHDNNRDDGHDNDIVINTNTTNLSKRRWQQQQQQEQLTTNLANRQTINTSRPQQCRNADERAQTMVYRRLGF